MGVCVTATKGPAFTSSGVLASIVHRQWRPAATGFCHAEHAIVSFVTAGSTAGILPMRHADRMRVTPTFVAGTTRPRAFGNPVESKGCIVIVEPDDLIRELLERWLGEAGYAIVLTARDNDTVMVVPHLVIADISSPGTSGPTIGALRAAYSAPILALSGRFRRGLGGSVDAAHRLHVGNVLPKPFTREELLAAVSEAIDGP